MASVCVYVIAYGATLPAMLFVCCWTQHENGEKNTLFQQWLANQILKSFSWNINLLLLDKSELIERAEPICKANPNFCDDRAIWCVSGENTTGELNESAADLDADGDAVYLQLSSSETASQALGGISKS